ncbi:MAG: hypothetical protein ACLP9L_35975 [Thermoguttaceae bacterium]
MFNRIQIICSAPIIRKPRKRAWLGFESLEKRELMTTGLASSFLGGISAMTSEPDYLGLGAIPSIADTTQGSGALTHSAEQASLRVAPGRVRSVDITSAAAAVLTRFPTSVHAGSLMSSSAAVQASFRVAPGRVAPVDIASAVEAVVTKLEAGGVDAVVVDIRSAAEAVVTQRATSVQAGIAICLFVAMVDTYGNVATGLRGAAKIQFDAGDAYRPQPSQKKARKKASIGFPAFENGQVRGA